MIDRKGVPATRLDSSVQTAAELNEVAEANGFYGCRFEADSRRGIEIQRRGLFVEEPAVAPVACNFPATSELLNPSPQLSTIRQLPISGRTE